ncbi:SDR family NAD(P)-dependent oxidoreductase [Marinivivus vitaminiproducens]|uniref:SDR family NAD(P)-dependent oxidoreductase n=1 Tax=Marinivivus vitaminiproducens TaxID=3035935 RepID=UPI0027A4352F|nr:SDR family NAD(P)-dependent oxidoreductase [Geminicoccaceae bacterium SCSIO 64248]
MSLTADLSGKTILVTGASQGLGRHFALTLAAAGAAVGLAARNAGKLAGVQAEIEAAGGKAAAAALDVTDEASIAAAVEAVEAALGGIDVLVNNAGTAITKPVLDQKAADWDAVVGTNLRGAFLVARTVAAAMRERGGGSIVNIASVLGLMATGGVAPYAASKAGLIHLTEVMALELARHGIRVNALAPGYIETAINRDFFATKAGEKLVARIAQRRLGQVGDLDGALLLLASDASRYMTGSVVVVDGGYRLG